MKNTDRVFNVIAITGGINVPSRRFRIDALKPYFLKRGIRLTELCPKISSYPPKNRILRIPWIVAAIVERFTFLFRARGYDAVILQREMISTLSTLEKYLPKPVFFDVDDAIFLYRNGNAARRISKLCSAVVCGNRYLGENFSKWNSNIYVIPTGVNTDILRPNTRIENSKKIIGWIGVAKNYRYLKLIEPALSKILKKYPDVHLQIISNKYPEFLEHLKLQLDFQLWHPGIENKLLPQFTVGIMPLADSEWVKGKCAFKMLQYMAAGIPVVATPIGVNLELFLSGNIGLPASNNDEWVEALETLLNSADERRIIGLNGRRLVEEKYSLYTITKEWRRVLMKNIN